ncbi:MAG: hypothetical protein AAFY56_16860 [Pseudomonadota bacterium]
MSSLLKNPKPNSVRSFNELRYHATLAHREIAAINQILDTTARDIQRAKLSEFDNVRVTALYWTLHRLGHQMIDRIEEQLRIIKAAIVMRHGPNLVSA